MPTLVQTWNELVTYLEKIEPAKITVEVEEPSDEDEPEMSDEEQDETFWYDKAQGGGTQLLAYEGHQDKENKL